VRSGKAHDADPSFTGRSSDGNDCFNGSHHDRFTRIE
jgi:hypothetical protein